MVKYCPTARRSRGQTLPENASEYCGMDRMLRDGWDASAATNKLPCRGRAFFRNFKIFVPLHMTNSKGIRGCERANRALSGRIFIFVPFFSVFASLLWARKGTKNRKSRKSAHLTWKKAGEPKLSCLSEGTNFGNPAKNAQSAFYARQAFPAAPKPFKITS